MQKIAYMFELNSKDLIKMFVVCTHQNDFYINT